MKPWNCIDCGDPIDRPTGNPFQCRDCWLESLDPDLFCLKHGTELPMGPYGIRYGGCEDCEPPEPDGEAFRGGEAAAYEREQMAAIRRDLK
jgi:hypothetical protein